MKKESHSYNISGNLANQQFFALIILRLLNDLLKVKMANWELEGKPRRLFQPKKTLNVRSNHTYEHFLAFSANQFSGESNMIKTKFLVTC